MSIPAGSRIFKGITGEALDRLLDCLSYRRIKFGKGRFILSAGERADRVGFILSGAVRVIHEDYQGRRMIIQVLHEGESFGAGFVFSDDEELDVSVEAVAPGELLLIPKTRLLHPCARACAAHRLLMDNLIYVLANRCCRLQLRSIMMSKRTIRGRLLTYLRQHAHRLGRSAFTVPFDRQALADFLCVDRSALSNEISKLHREGRLSVHGNHFELPS